LRFVGCVTKLPLIPFGLKLTRGGGHDISLQFTPRESSWIWRWHN